VDTHSKTAVNTLATILNIPSFIEKSLCDEIKRQRMLRKGEVPPF
jgi:hypothetical protein